MTKSSPVSINLQIAAVRRITDVRANYLADRVASGKVSQAKADDELDALEAAYRTLSFVRKYADGFRSYIEAQQKFERERAAEIASASGQDGAQ